MSCTSQSLLSITEELHREQLAIETWFNQQWQHVSAPFYSSVDLRQSAFKLAPIDVNLYPAGFNNLSKEDEDYAVEQVKKMMQQKGHHFKNVLIITENHTRNLYYLEHLAKLKNILTRAGCVVKLSMLDTVNHLAHTLSGQPLSFEAVTKEETSLRIEAFIPDGIILNNDLSEGFPDLFANLQQPILPTPLLGWYQRKKSYYFEQYDKVCKAFSNNFGWDNWLLNPLFTACDQVNFTPGHDQTELVQKAQVLFNKIEEKYQTYGISQKPYLILKADSGSYGMGVLTLESADMITHLSRKHRQHMSKTKGNRLIESVILQEGIPTNTQFEQHPSEPVIYLMGEKAVGGFYRTHHSRTIQENLNTPGMQLKPFALHSEKSGIEPRLLYAYQVIARLATLAAAFEIDAIHNSHKPIPQ